VDGGCGDGGPLEGIMKSKLSLAVAALGWALAVSVGAANTDTIYDMSVGLAAIR
jgi:hypothetical protein